MRIVKKGQIYLEPWDHGDIGHGIDLTTGYEWRIRTAFPKIRFAFVRQAQNTRRPAFTVSTH